MIRPFTGEFLSAPMALEIDMTTCNYQCLYCYARCQDKLKKFNIKSIVTALKKSVHGTTIQDYLIRNHYPICLSNRTDPLSPVNASATLPLLKILFDNGQQVAPLTKGGDAFDKVLDIYKEYDKKGVFYFTITTTNEKIRKHIEPGAPPTEDRLDMIKEAIKQGHKIIVAVNPLLEKWMDKDEFKAFIDKTQKTGVSGYWIAALHMGKNMKNAYAQRAFAELKSVYNEEGFGKKAYDMKRQLYVQDCVEYLVAKNIPVHCSHMPFINPIHQIYESVYKIMPPTKTAFVNAKIKDGKDCLCFFDDYYKITITGQNKELFEMNFKPVDVQRYLFILGYRISKLFDKTSTRLKDLLRFLWNCPQKTKMMPIDNILFLRCFSKGVQAKDTAGNNIYHFSLDNIKYNRAGKCIYNLDTGRREIKGKEVVL